MRSVKRYLFIFLLLLATPLIAGNNEDGADRFSWHEVLNYPFFAAMLGDGSLTVSQENDAISAIHVTRPPPGEPDRKLSVAIDIEPGSSLLSKQQYDDAVARVTEAEKARDFPALGARAQMLPVFAGPDGASHGIILTTMDEKFDIRVVVLDSGTEQGPPAPDPAALAVKLLDRYRPH